MANLLIVSDEISIQKKGGTDLIRIEKGNNLKWQWTAMDTVSVWNKATWWEMCGTLKPWPCKKSRNDEVIKMGYGAAHALRLSKTNLFGYNKYKSANQTPFYNQGSQKQLKQWKHWGNDHKNKGAWRNKMSAKKAYETDKNNNLAKVGGLYPFYDLVSDEPKDIGPNLITLLRKNSDGVRVQQTLDKNNNKYNRSNLFKIEQQGGLPNNTLYGLSKAETYFSRPRDLWARTDKYREYGNLYNPFWQTRLIANTSSEQAAAIAAALLIK